MGQVLQAGAGQAPARQAAVGAGIPKEVPADTINKVCASSIRALEIADLMIRSGGHELVVTGGMESMSNAPYLLPKARFGYRLGNGEVVDHMVFDGLTSSFDGLHMVQQASLVSRELGISREDQDEWAYRSQQRAAAAQDSGRFDDEIVAVGDVAADEGVRRDTTLEKLSALEPVFDPEGTTTAGNAPGVNDGASCVVVCSEEFAQRREPRAAGDDPRAGLRRGRLRVPGAHAGAGRREGSGRWPGSRSATSSVSRSTRRSRRSRRTRPGCSEPTKTSSTSTAARSRSAIRSARRAAGSWRRWCTSCAGRAVVSGSRRSAPAAARAMHC